MSDKVTQSIFAAIDSGSYKVAQSLCSQQLQKYPSSSYYYALMSYVLLMSGEKEDAIKQARQLMEKTPSDSNALEILNIVFRRAGLYKESVQIYENACKKYPTLTLVQSWFELSIKRLDIMSLQKSSMALLKQVPPDETRQVKIWCAFNLYMTSTLKKISDQQRNLFPKLGLKMMEELRPFNSSAQESFVYCNLLLSTGKHDEAITTLKEFLEGQSNLELQIMLLNALAETERYHELYNITSKILFKDKFDDWNCWKKLILAATHNGKLAEVYELAYNVSPATRNSKLAVIEISSKSSDSQFSIRDAVEDYLSHFSTKASCYPDLINYMNEIPAGEFLELLESLRNKQDSTKSTLLNLKQLTFFVNYMRFKTQLTPNFINEPDFIEENLRYYNASKHLLKQKEKTDYFIGNEFLLLICRSILRSKNSTLSAEDICKCIIILENATGTDVHEFHLRIWLVRLYSLIGCFTKAKAHYDTLKIKFVQNDTLSYYLLADIGGLQPNKEMQKMIASAQSVYNNNQRETTYFIKEAYDRDTFDKIQGFVEFGLRLNNSITRYLNLIEAINISRINGEDETYKKTYEELVKAYSLSSSQLSSTKSDFDERLCDNRDFKIMWDFGTFTKDNELEKLFWGGDYDNEYEPVRHSSYVNAVICKELLIAKDGSKESITGLVTQLQKTLNDNNHNFVTLVEKFEIETIAQVVNVITSGKDDIDMKGIKKTALTFVNQKQSTKPKTISHRFRELFTIIRFCKELTTIKNNYKAITTERQNKALAIMPKEIMNYLRDQELITELKETHQADLITQKRSINEWFKKQAGSGFSSITNDYIDDIFDDIKQSSLIPIKILSSL